MLEVEIRLHAFDPALLNHHLERGFREHLLDRRRNLVVRWFVIRWAPVRLELEADWGFFSVGRGSDLSSLRVRVSSCELHSLHRFPAGVWVGVASGFGFQGLWTVDRSDHLLVEGFHFLFFFPSRSLDVLVEKLGAINYTVTVLGDVKL